MWASENVRHRTTEGVNSMVYVGHFSFVEDEAGSLVGDEPRHGYFTAVAEAKDVEDALEKFRTLICRLHSEGDALDGISDVFLNACVECRAIPDSGFLAYFMEWFGQARSSISTAIRGAEDEQAAAYYLTPEDLKDAGDEHYVEPFVSFER